MPFGISFQYDISLGNVSCGYGDGCVGNLLMWGIIPFLFSDVIKTLAGMVILPIGWKFFVRQSAAKVVHESYGGSTTVLNE